MSQDLTPMVVRDPGFAGTWRRPHGLNGEGQSPTFETPSPFRVAAVLAAVVAPAVPSVDRGARETGALFLGESLAVGRTPE
jgi:hypothetical protein